MKDLHIIPHSHLDREWYMSFEQHRARLVELMDTLIELMENNPEYKYFHLDGQFIVIEDYLQIKPYMRERLYKLIREDRIQIGPWYILQDEYLTSGEANVRNMLYGLKLCREIGAEPVMVGYFPDAFGNISQAPQILRGFDIDKAAFGRGIGEIAADNVVIDNGITNPSELIWESPDGSKVTSVMFCNWYANANELPTDDDKVKEAFEDIIKKAEECALTPHLLGMNGCDHQPVQTDLTVAIEKAEKVISDIEIKHSNFKDYFEAIMPYAEKFPTIVGEIAGQRTNGMCLLVNTASTHIPLKQKNHKAQNMLEQISEPMNAMSFLSGDTYRNDMLLYSWKKLMENHPHDSICSCSCDEVTREMDIRFDKSIQMAEFVRDEAKDFIVHNIATESDKNIVVFHTNPGKTKALITAFADFERDDNVSEITVYDKNGNVVPSYFKVMGDTFTYTLPKDSFRKVKYVNRVKITMLVEAEGVGYETYTVKKETKEFENRIKVFENGAENETISFKIEKNGSLTVTDKVTGTVYSGMNVYEDCGDGGESYNFRQIEGDTPITTVNNTAKVWIKRQTPFTVTFGIENLMMLPKSKKTRLSGKRSKEFEITTFVTLTAGIPRIDVKTKYHNRSEDHRVRALFDTNIDTDVVFADGQFDLVERNITPWEGWQNPSNCQRHQSFFALENDKNGLLIAGRGLHEYEVLRNGKNTMALTILRSVGEVGDWGIFPTPDMQCKGKNTVYYSIVPYAVENKSDAYETARAFSSDRFVTQDVNRQEGTLKNSDSFIKAEGEHLTISALKKSENGDGIIVRLYNTDTSAHKATLTVNPMFTECYFTNLEEKRLSKADLIDGKVTIDMGAKKIVTIELL